MPGFGASTPIREADIRVGNLRVLGTELFAREEGIVGPGFKCISRLGVRWYDKVHWDLFG